MIKIVLAIACLAAAANAGLVAPYGGYYGYAAPALSYAAPALATVAHAPVAYAAPTASSYSNTYRTVNKPLLAAAPAVVAHTPVVAAAPAYSYARPLAYGGLYGAATYGYGAALLH